MKDTNIKANQKVHPKHSMLSNSKYSALWNKLKEANEATITVFDREHKARVVRGVSQLKNIDLQYKENNYYKRITVEVVRQTSEGYLILKLSLVESLKYRNGIF